MDTHAHDISGILEDVTVPPGQPWGCRLKKGQHLRIIDLMGKQAVDFLCYESGDPKSRYNAANTIKKSANIFLRKGSTLWSDRGRKMMTITEDTCGFHDTIGGCCSADMNMALYGKAGIANCRDTFEAGLKRFDLKREDIVSNINWFMYVPVAADGQTAIAEGVSKPGDYVDLVAECDVICVASNCAQVFNPANGYNPTPVRIITYDPALVGR